MDKEEKQAWRTIVAILQETGYDKLYDEEVHIVAECLRRCEQQCKKQKEVIDKGIKYVEDYTNGERIITYEQYKSELLNILKEVSE